MTTRFPAPPVPADDPDPLHRLTVYRLAREALLVAQADVMPMRTNPFLAQVAGQLVRAVGSIAANIAEGYSRGSAAERRKFLEYALGSARESVVWYEAAGVADANSRIERLTSIRRLLLTMIRTARTDTARDRSRFHP